MDVAILSAASEEWRKVFRVVLTVSQERHEQPEMVGARIERLVAAGKLESRKNLTLWRFSEIRLPGGSG